MPSPTSSMVTTSYGRDENGNIWLDSMHLRMNVQAKCLDQSDREGDAVDLSPYKIAQPPGRKFKKQPQLSLQLVAHLLTTKQMGRSR